MKSLITKILAFTLFLFTFGCEKDESLNPLPINVPGSYIRLNILNDRLDFNNKSSTFFGGELTSPSGSIVRYELFVRRFNSDGILVTDFKPLLTINSFPHDLKITPQEIATALNLQLSDLKNGEKYYFAGYSYDEKGIKIGFTELSALVRSSKSMKQGYRFTTILTSDLTGPLDNYDF